MADKPVIDLMAALKKSLREEEERRAAGEWVLLNPPQEPLPRVEPTEGPWHVVENIDAANHGRRVVGGGRVVAECSCLDPATNEANARLIAAAADPCRERAIARLCEVAEEAADLLARECYPATAGGLRAAVAAVRGPREERHDG